MIDTNGLRILEIASGKSQAQVILWIQNLVAYNERLEAEILKVPEFLVYPWDWKECLFCHGKREHKPDCIRDELEQKKNEQISKNETR